MGIGRKLAALELSVSYLDLHRHRSAIVRDDHRGKEVAVTKIENDPLTLAKVVSEAGEAPEGPTCHLVHASGMNWDDRRGMRTCHRTVSA